MILLPEGEEIMKDLVRLLVAKGSLKSVSNINFSLHILGGLFV